MCFWMFTSKYYLQLNTAKAIFLINKHASQNKFVFMNAAKANFCLITAALMFNCYYQPRICYMFWMKLKNGQAERNTGCMLKAKFFSKGSVVGFIWCQLPCQVRIYWIFQVQQEWKLILTWCGTCHLFWFICHLTMTIITYPNCYAAIPHNLQKKRKTDNVWAKNSSKNEI